MALRRVLIANRGEIAVRVIKACFDEGIESVLAVSQADQGSLGAQLADQVVDVDDLTLGDVAGDDPPPQDLDDLTVETASGK